MSSSKSGAAPEEVFESEVDYGSYRRALNAVLDGDADVAAIYCTFADERGSWLVSARRGFLEYALRLADLLRKGDSRANVMLMPGDVIIIPESMF